MKLHRVLFLRKFVMPVLKKISRDVEIQHPWVAEKTIKLNLFKHKGYWYHRKRREEQSMVLFKEIISSNSNIIEVGGHIGFVSILFDRINGPSGKTYVFEPGSNNLPYIEQNIGSSSRIKLIKKAVGNQQGTIDFFEDNLTGQNNSVVENFEGLKVNQSIAFVESKTKKVSVPITSLDAELGNLKIDFIKIDIEGGEWPALLGAQDLMSRQKPALMVEILANEDEIFTHLSNLNYVLFNDSKQILKSKNKLKGNIFCLHNEAHKELIDNLLPSF